MMVNVAKHTATQATTCTTYLLPVLLAHESYDQLKPTAVVDHDVGHVPRLAVVHCGRRWFPPEL